MIEATNIMITAVLIPLLMALVAQGAYAAQQEGMFAHWLTYLWEAIAWPFPKKWQKYIHKPLFTCPICMVSVWGIPTWWMFGGGYLVYLPFYILAAAGINAVITKD